MNHAITIRKIIGLLYNVVSSETQSSKFMSLAEISTFYGEPFGEWLGRMEPSAFPIHVSIKIETITVLVENVQSSVNLRNAMESALL